MDDGSAMTEDKGLMPFCDRLSYMLKIVGDVKTVADSLGRSETEVMKWASEGTQIDTPKGVDFSDFLNRFWEFSDNWVLYGLGDHPFVKGSDEENESKIRMRLMLWY